MERERESTQTDGGNSQCSGRGKSAQYAKSANLLICWYTGREQVTAQRVLRAESNIQGRRASPSLCVMGSGGMSLFAWLLRTTGGGQLPSP